MKVPQYITTSRAITVSIALIVMALVVLGDVLILLAALPKGS